MICPIDGNSMEFVFQAEILKKYPAEYYRCTRCRLLQPANPHWLAESYESAIAASDVGLALRNKLNLQRLETILHRLHGESGRILDVGGGYGLLCRGLRDIGFDCFTSDLYCENLFAANFEPNKGFQAETLLAFEVFEHIANPLDFTREKMAEYGAQRFIFSTLTYSGDEPPPQDWWYYAYETGQHISLYHENSLQALAAELSLHYFSVSPDLHVLSLTPIDITARVLLDMRGRFVRRLYPVWTRFVRKGASLTQADYQCAKSMLVTREQTEPE